MTPTPTRGVKVVLDRERHLRYPLSALREIDGNASLDFLLWLGLRHEDADLTQEQVADFVDLAMLPSLRDPLKQASGGQIDLGKLGIDDEGEEAPKKGGPAAKKGPKSGA